MTGGEFVELARKMIVMHRGVPAGLRSVVSRAYYGVYHIAREFLEQMHFHPEKNENAHLFVQVHLRHSDEEHAEDVAALLGDLHERRKRADYEIGDRRYEIENFAIDSLTRAERSARILAICSQEPIRSKIEAGITNYRHKLSVAGRDEPK